jgi:hypothetical protein
MIMAETWAWRKSLKELVRRGGGEVFMPLCDKKKYRKIILFFLCNFPRDFDPIFLSRQLHEWAPLTRCSLLLSH